MDSIKLIPFIILAIAISGIVAGAAAISLAKFEGTTTDKDAIGAINNATAGVGDAAEQLPTVAIIGIMVIIISLLGGVFAYFRYFR
jgi:hypothetical protein